MREFDDRFRPIQSFFFFLKHTNALFVYILILVNFWHQIICNQIGFFLGDKYKAVIFGKYSFFFSFSFCDVLWFFFWLVSQAYYVSELCFTIVDVCYGLH